MGEEKKIRLLNFVKVKVNVESNFYYILYDFYVYLKVSNFVKIVYVLVYCLSIFVLYFK